jgi:hypothetical protein
LEVRVEGRRVRGAALLVVPVATAGAGLGCVAGGEPLLGQVSESEVVGAPGPPILVGTQPGSTALL